MADPLDALRPLHLPVTAEGTTVVLAMALAGLVLALLAGAWLLPRLARRHAVRRAALERLAQSRALPPPERIAAQAMLLRRLARTLGTDASAQGEDWLAGLDALFATQFFTAGAGRALVDAPYRRVAAPEVAALDQALAQLFARLRR